ncbi:hypothetical protein MMC11_007278 [Xylographa trunciseda]|nr:hypothetical protein [Xylographa trunciseda]
MGPITSKGFYILAPPVTSQNAAHRPSQHGPDEDPSENPHLRARQRHDHPEKRGFSDNPVPQDRIQGLKEALRREKKKVTVLAESNRKAQDEVSELQNTCAALQRNLTACKHDLFSLQPSNQISDSEIADKFEHLSQQISQWSDETFKDIDWMQQRLEDRLVDHTYFPIAKSVDPESDEMLKHIPSAAEFFMHHVIFQHLQQTVFDEENYLFGLHPGIGAIFRLIENRMRLLEPKRDSSVINKWRSETLLSFTATPEFAQELNRQVQAISNTLKEALRENFPILIFLDDCFTKLQEQIVKPAVDLAIVMQKLPVLYGLIPQLSFPPISVDQILFPAALECAVVKDMATRKTLTLRSKVVSDKHGCVGDRVMMTEPGLVRYGTDVQTEVVVRKPQLVVYLKEPLDKRQK